MTKIKKMLSFFMIVFGCLYSASLVVTAAQINIEGFDYTQEGSIVIDYKKEEEPLADVEFQVYQITEADESYNQILQSKYEGMKIELDELSDSEYWKELSNELEYYINYEIVSPELTFVTNDDGTYKIEDLELGIYYIQSDVIQEDGTELYSEPILIMVGDYDNSNEEWRYQYTIQPKVAMIAESKEQLTVEKVWENTNSDELILDEVEVAVYCDGELYDTVILSEENLWKCTWYDIDKTKTWAVKELTESEEFTVRYERNLYEFTVINTYIGEADEELPQTGSFSYMITILSGFGLICLSLGILLKYKFRDKENE